MQSMLIWWSFIGIIVFVAWRGNKWFAQRNTAHADTHQGETYNYREERSKYGKLVNLLLTFDVPSARHFRLRRESWFDRFGKGIRLAVEAEANEPVFDKMFFLDSDDEVLVALLMQERKLRSALIILMGRIARQRARLISLDAENGKLTLYMRAFSVAEPVRLREECVAFLTPLLQAIRELPTMPTREVHRAIDSAKMLRRLALILFAIGTGSITWIAFMCSDRLVEPWLFARLSGMVGVLAFVVLSMWALRQLGRSSNRHRAMLFWTFFSLIGLLCCSFVALRAANIHLDFAEHESLVADNVTLSEYYRRKVGTTYSIVYHLEDRSESEFGSATIDWFDSRKLRKTWNNHDSGPGILYIHRGLLGFQWKKIEALPNIGND